MKMSLPSRHRHVDTSRPENRSRPGSGTNPPLCAVSGGSHPYRGFQHEFRNARHRSFGSQAREGQLASHPVQAARLFPPVESDRPTSYAAPFLSCSSHDGAPPMSAGSRPAFDAVSLLAVIVSHVHAKSAAHGFEESYAWRARRSGYNFSRPFNSPPWNLNVSPEIEASRRPF